MILSIATIPTISKQINRIGYIRLMPLPLSPYAIHMNFRMYTITIYTAAGRANRTNGVGIGGNLGNENN